MLNFFFLITWMERERILIKFADDTKVEWAANSLEDRIRIQKDRNKLES